MATWQLNQWRGFASTVASSWSVAEDGWHQCHQLPVEVVLKLCFILSWQSMHATKAYCSVALTVDWRDEGALAPTCTAAQRMVDAQMHAERLESSRKIIREATVSRNAAYQCNHRNDRCQQGSTTPRVSTKPPLVLPSSIYSAVFCCHCSIDGLRKEARRHRKVKINFPSCRQDLTLPASIPSTAGPTLERPAMPGAWSGGLVRAR